MQKLIFRFLLALGFCLSVSANAVPTLIKQGGKYYGATGIEVNNIIYNVAFIDGIFGDVFAGDDWLPFTNEADVWLANGQLHSLIMAEEALDTDPSLTAGCSSPEVCFILSPIATRADDGAYVPGEKNPFHSYLRSATTINGAGIASGFDSEGVSDSYLFIDSHTWINLTWAKWSLSTVKVPESSSLVLVFIGSLLFLGRRYFAK